MTKRDGINICVLSDFLARDKEIYTEQIIVENRFKF